MLPNIGEKDCKPRSPPGPPPKLDLAFLNEYQLVQSASVSRSKMVRPTIKSVSRSKSPNRSRSLSRSIRPTLRQKSSPSLSRSKSPAQTISHIIHKKFIE